MALSAYDTQTTIQTDTSLIAAPGAGKTIRVWSVYAACVMTQKVTFESGNATEKFAVWLPDGGNRFIEATRQPLFECAENEALTYTTTHGGDTTVSVWFDVDA